jgi:hypothetical protein
MWEFHGVYNIAENSTKIVEFVILFAKGPKHRHRNKGMNIERDIFQNMQSRIYGHKTLIYVLVLQVYLQ